MEVEGLGPPALMFHTSLLNPVSFFTDPPIMIQVDTTSFILCYYCHGR